MAADQQAVRAAIDAANRRFEAGFAAGDAARAAHEVYTAGARLLPPDMAMVTGRDAIAAFWVGAASQMAIQGVRLATQELAVFDDHAHEIGRATLTLASGQQPEAKYVVIWKHEAGEWRWDVDIWNMGT